MNLSKRKHSLSTRSNQEKNTTNEIIIKNNQQKPLIFMNRLLTRNDSVGSDLVAYDIKERIIKQYPSPNNNNKLLINKNILIKSKLSAQIPSPVSPKKDGFKKNKSLAISTSISSNNKISKDEIKKPLLVNNFRKSSRLIEPFGFSFPKLVQCNFEDSRLMNNFIKHNLK